jgi:hypothetical protein
MLRAVSPNTEIPVFNAECFIVLIFTNMNRAINGRAHIIAGKTKESKMSIIFIAISVVVNLLLTYVFAPKNPITNAFTSL